MKTPISLLKTAACALAFAVTVTPALADLSAEEAAQVEKLRGTPVLSSDGALVGTIEGASIQSDRASLFVHPSPGSLFRLRGKDVVIRTQASEITLQANAIVLNSDEQRIKIRAVRIKDDDQMIEVILPRR